MPIRRGKSFTARTHDWSPNSAVAPDANRCFTVLQEPSFIASRFAPVNRGPLGGNARGHANTFISQARSSATRSRHVLRLLSNRRVLAFIPARPLASHFSKRSTAFFAAAHEIHLDSLARRSTAHSSRVPFEKRACRPTTPLKLTRRRSPAASCPSFGAQVRCHMKRRAA